MARRFGADKRRVPVQERGTLLELSRRCYASTGLSTLVALSARSEDDSLATLLGECGQRFLRCDRAAGGIGSTIAQSMQSIGNPPALFVALGDMPLVRPATLAVLESHARRDRIVFPVCNGRRGHPVVFGARFFSALRSLAGERGGAALLDANADACLALPVEDSGVLFDVDTPAQLRELRRHLQFLSGGGASG